MSICRALLEPATGKSALLRKQIPGVTFPPSSARFTRTSHFSPNVLWVPDRETLVLCPTKHARSKGMQDRCLRQSFQDAAQKGSPAPNTAHAPAPPCPLCSPKLSDLNFPLILQHFAKYII